MEKELKEIDVEPLRVTQPKNQSSWSSQTGDGLSSLGSLLERRAGQHPQRIALLDTAGREITFRKLLFLVSSTVSAFSSDTQIVAVAMPHGLNLALTLLSVASTRTCLPLPPDLTHSEYQKILLESGAQALLASPKQALAVSAARDLGLPIRPELESSEGEATLQETTTTALLLQTSGTTGSAKRISLTHQNLLYSATQMAEVLGLSPDDRCLGVLPFYHIHGLSTLLASLVAGSTIICPGQFESQEYLDAMLTYQPTWYSASPTIHRLALESWLQSNVKKNSLRFLRSASAAMPTSLRNRLEKAFGVRLLEAYGKTETSPQISCQSLDDIKVGSVGKPRGVEVKIVDETGKSLPPDQTGEIVVSGPNLSPDCGASHHTGDLGYLDSDGHLFVVGRKKEMINRGGVKLAPREIECAALEHPKVVEAAAFPLAHEVLGETVGLALVSTQTISDNEMRLFLQERLASFKLPERIIHLDTLPRGSGRKIQRQELSRLIACCKRPPKLSLVRDTEQSIRLIWSEVLGSDTFDQTSNFFTLGGHSLAAGRVLTRYRERHGWQMSLNEFFLYPEIESQAQLLSQRERESAQKSPKAKLEDARAFPLTSPQRRLWFLQKRFPQSSAYNMSCLLHIRGELDIGKLERAIESVIFSHSPLRTRFWQREGEPRQAPSEAKEFFLPCFNLDGRDEEACAALLRAEIVKPFQFEKGLLFRAALLSLKRDSHQLLLVVHHIVFDGWSWSVLLRDLQRFYEGEVALENRAYFLRSEQPSSHSSYSLKFWKNELLGFPTFLELPTEKPDGLLPSVPRCGEVHFQIKDALAEKLRRLSLRSYEVFLGGLAVLLNRLTDQKRFLVGTPVANRSDSEAENMVGLFANTLPLPIQLRQGSTFRNLLTDLERLISKGLEHQDVPLDHLLEEMRVERDSTHNPLFQVQFAYQNYPFELPEKLTTGLNWERVELEGHEAKFPLALYLTPVLGGWKGRWRFDSRLLAEATVAAWSRSFLNILERVADNPETPLDELDASSDVSILSGPSRPMPTACVVERIAHFAARTPKAIAIEWEEEILSYQTLWERVDQLARGLIADGVGRGNVVAVCCPRGATAVALFLAVWRVGAVLLPLDPSYPTLRRDFCLKQSAASHLVGELSADSDYSGSVLSVEHLLCCNGTTDLPELPSLEETAYIVFTSGSTGQPKGVVISHANLTHYWDALGARLKLQAEDRWFHTASYAFSSSFRQFVLPLTHGATVVGASRKDLTDPACLLNTVLDRRVTILDLVPTHWKVCLRGQTRPVAHSLRLLLSASEPLGRETACALLQQFEDAVLVNMYGQTETTGIVATKVVQTESHDSVTSLGEPLARMHFSLLNEAGKPMPVGAVGRLAVSGPGVGRYLICQEKPPHHMTGDLARLGADESLQYRGRIDAQLKIRGFRVEPVEVESVLERHPRVEDALISECSTGLKATLKVSGPVTLSEIQVHCARYLPPYMVPSALDIVDAFKTNQSGKIDRRPSKVLESGTFEDQLTVIWKRVLGANKVGPNDNFFELGGNSILSVEIVASAQELGIPITLELLFQHQTIAGICRVLSGEESSGGEKKVRVSAEDALRWGITLLCEAGLEKQVAGVVAQVQLEASMRGQKTHNLTDIPRYAKRVKEGILNASPRLTIIREDDVFLLIDADNGPGQWAATRAMDLAVKKASKHGIGLASVRRSNHFGAAGSYPLMAASKGLIGFVTTNGPLILAPTGGVTPTFGNNPMAFAIPAQENAPVMLDIALSVAPRGRIGHHVARGQPLPEGWILDSEGFPTTDLADLAAGLGVPIGGHKGYGLAFIMEVLAGVLSGAGFGRDHVRERTPIDLGHFFLALDPSRLAEPKQFRGAVDQLIAQTKASKPDKNTAEILYPGEKEWKAYKESLKFGVEVPESVAEEIFRTARSTL